MAVRNYYIDAADGVTIFTGFVGTTKTSPTTCGKLTGAVSVTGTATKNAGIKARFLPQGTKATTTMNICGSTYRLSPNNMTNTALWYSAASIAIATAYTAATTVKGGTIQMLYKRIGDIKFWIDAYNSAGTRVASTAAGTVGVTQTNTSVFTSFVVPTSKAVSVPANGYAVLRIGVKRNPTKTTARIMCGDTARVNGNSGPAALQWNPDEAPAISGPQASGAITDGNDVAAGVGDVQTIFITHIFKNSDDSAFWADGINVVAYKASTMNLAIPIVLGNAIISGGIGSVTINLNENTPVVLVPDHQHASAPAGEQGISEALTPTVG